MLRELGFGFIQIEYYSIVLKSEYILEETLLIVTSNEFSL